MDDPDPSSYEPEHQLKPHKLRAEKYENTQIIWFATNSQGEHPLLVVPILFIGLCVVMGMCLYYFYHFQQAQEDLAEQIDYMRTGKRMRDAGQMLDIVKEEENESNA